MDNKTLIKNDSEIYSAMHQYFQEFLIKWPLFAASVIINFDDIKEFYRNDIFIVSFFASDSSNHSTIRVNLSAIKNSDFHEDIFYRFTITLYPESIGILNKDNYCPETIYNNFYTLIETLSGVPKDTNSAVDLSFNENAEPVEIFTGIQNIGKSKGFSSIIHSLYEESDVDYLVKHNLDIEQYRENLRNFYFLWQNTSIRNVINKKFDEAFLAYIQDIQRYHILIAMNNV